MVWYVAYTCVLGSEFERRGSVSYIEALKLSIKNGYAASLIVQLET